jgi:hypothetical protein
MRLLPFALAAGLALTLAPAALAKHHKHHHRSASWSWSTSTIPGNAQIQGLSCPSAGLCVASGPVGLDSASPTNNVFWTTTPGAGAWQTAALEAAVQPSLSAGPEPIPEDSCVVGTSFCVIADGFANLFETNNPTGGGGAWQESTPTGVAFVGLSCFSSVCGAIDVSGDAVATTNSVVNSIHPVFSASGGLSDASISCTASGFCAAVDDSNAIAWTSNLLGGSWQTGTFAADEELGTIDCPASNLCLLGGSKLYVSTNPAAGPSSFKAVKGVLPGDISCSSASFCAMTTRSSAIEVSTNPADGDWKRVKAPGVPGLISCPQTDVCVITEGAAGAALGRG